MLFLLVELSAVKVHEAVLVAAEATGHPVEDNANVGLVAGVDEVLELLGRTIATGGRVVARHLIAPGAIKGMLHDGQDLDMGVTHLLDVIHELNGQLVVAEIRAAVIVAIGITVSRKAVVVALPAAQVHLKDVEWLLEHRAFCPLLQVSAIGPLITLDVSSARRRPRRALGTERVGICLIEQVAVWCLDEVLVELTLLHTLDEAPPDAARLGWLQVRCLLIPVVELANDPDALGVGCPDGKVIALDAQRRRRMAS